MKRLISLFFGLFLLSLCVHTPAVWVYRLAAPQLPYGVGVSQVKGTLWHGQANLQWQDIALEPIEWHFSPAQLFDLALGWQWAASPWDMTALLAIKPWQVDVLSHLEIHADTHNLQNALPWLAGISTRLHAAVDNVSAHHCSSATGQITLHNTTVFELPLGVILGDVSCQEDRYHVKLHNTQAPIKLTGGVTFSTQGRYQIEGGLSTEDPALQQQLAMLFGGKQGQRAFVIKQRGQL